MNSKLRNILRKILTSVLSTAMVAGSLSIGAAAPVAAAGPKTFETVAATVAAPALGANMGTIDNSGNTTYWFGGNAFYGMKRNGIEFGEDYDTSDWLLVDTDAMWPDSSKNGQYLFSTWGNAYNNADAANSDLWTYSKNNGTETNDYYYQKILTYNEALYQKKVKNWLKGGEAAAIGTATVTTTNNEYRTFEDYVKAKSGTSNYNYWIGGMTADNIGNTITYVVNKVKKWYESSQKDTTKYLDPDEGTVAVNGSASGTAASNITKADGVVTYENKTGDYINSTNYNGITETELGVKGSNIYSLIGAHLYSPSVAEFQANEKVYKKMIANIRNDATGTTTDSNDVSGYCPDVYTWASASSGYPSAIKNKGKATANPAKNLWDRTRTNLWARSFGGRHMDGSYFGAWHVNLYGHLNSSSDLTRCDAVAPAFNLDTSSVTMALSPNSAEGAGITPYDPDGLGENVEFALQSDKLNITADSFNQKELKNVVPGVTYTVPYTATLTSESTQGSETGKYIAAAIYDAQTDKMEYFGRLEGTASTSGTASITMPSDLKAGKEYKIALFVLQMNGSYEVTTPMQKKITTYTTDYASAPVVAKFTLDYSGSENPANNGWQTWEDENGITWNYALSGSNTVEYLWTAETDATKMGKLIKDDTLYVPSRINGLKVTGIGGGARNKTFIPESVAGWDKIYFPASIERIHDLAFVDFGNISEVTVPATVTEIGQKAFENSSITTLTLDGNTGIIGEEAFKGCASLTNVTVNKGDAPLVIAEYAFDGSDGFNVIDLPGNVVLQEYAFNNCGLGTVYINSAQVPANSFAGCLSITKVFLGSSVTEVDYNWNGQSDGQTINNRLFVVKNGDTAFKFYQKDDDKVSAFGTTGDVKVYYNTGSDTTSTKTTENDVTTIKTTILAKFANDDVNYTPYYKGAGLAADVQFKKADQLDEESTERQFLDAGEETAEAQTGITASSIGTLYWGEGKTAKLNKDRITVRAAFGGTRGETYGSDHFYVVRTAGLAGMSDEDIKTATIETAESDLTKGYIEATVCTFESYDGNEYTEIPEGGKFTAEVKIRVDKYSDQSYVEDKYEDFSAIVSAINSLESEIETLNTEAAGLRDTADRLTTENGNLTEEVAEKTKEAAKLNATLEAKQAELDNLYAALEEYTGSTGAQTSYTGILDNGTKVVFIGTTGTRYDETGKNISVGGTTYPVFVTAEAALDATGAVIAPSGTYFYVAEDGVHKVTASGGEYYDGDPATYNGSTVYTTELTDGEGNKSEVEYIKDGENNVTVVEKDGNSYKEAADQSKADEIKGKLESGEIGTVVTEKEVYSDSLAASIAAAKEQLDLLQASLDDSKDKISSMAAGLTSIVNAVMSEGSYTITDIYSYTQICNAIYDLISRLNGTTQDAESAKANYESQLAELQKKYDQLEADYEELKKKKDSGNEGSGGGNTDPSNPDPSVASVVIVFKPNKTGATISERTKVVTNGEKYGEMPTPACTGFTFTGWYTEETNGTLITADTVVTSADATKNLYGHWSEDTVPAEEKTVTVSENKIDQPTDGIIKANESVVPASTKWVINPSMNAVQVSVSDKKIVKAKLKKKDGSIRVTAKKPGTADVVVTGSNGESMTYKLHVEKPKVNKSALKVSMATVSMNLADYMQGITLLKPTKVESKNSSVAKVSENGLITLGSAGKSKITLWFGKKKFKGTLKVS